VSGPDSCGNCRYSKLDSAGSVRVSRQCRRHPPTMLGSRVGWPFVDSFDWCGEHRRNPDAA
jgi:hypothetical protein